MARHEVESEVTGNVWKILWRSALMSPKAM